MEKKNNYRWIAEEIDISDILPRLPKHVLECIRNIEKADLDNNMPAFYQLCDNLEIYTKLLIPDIITVKEWDMICEKYCLID